MRLNRTARKLSTQSLLTSYIVCSGLVSSSNALGTPFLCACHDRGKRRLIKEHLKSRASLDENSACIREIVMSLRLVNQEKVDTGRMLVARNLQVLLDLPFVIAR